jgi:hypothetical protein
VGPYAKSGDDIKDGALKSYPHLLAGSYITGAGAGAGAGACC